MSLCKSPARTPAFLAANRRNAQKCTGPRTPQGKARSSLNALKHGRYARRLPETLAAAGLRSGFALYAQIHAEISVIFGVSSPEGVRLADAVAAGVWSMAWGAGVLGTKPRSPVFFEASGSRLLSLSPTRFGMRDSRRRIGLVYWVQRRRYLTRKRLIEVLVSDLPPEIPPPGQGLEGKLRRRVFRMRRPGFWKRMEHGLDQDGNRDPSLTPGLSPELERLKRLHEKLMPAAGGIRIRRLIPPDRAVARASRPLWRERPAPARRKVQRPERKGRCKPNMRAQPRAGRMPATQRAGRPRYVMSRTYFATR
jgi:hypothetical protein